MKRVWLVGLGSIAALVIASCGGSSTDSGRTRAATYGPVDGSVLKSLGGLLSFGGSVDAAQLLVVDGTRRSLDGLPDDPVIGKHLRKGGDLLMLNVRAEQKDTVTQLFKASKPGNSFAVIARRMQDAAGRPRVYMLDLPDRAGDPNWATQQKLNREALAQYIRGETFREVGRNGEPYSGLISMTWVIAAPSYSYFFTSTKDGKDTSNGTQSTSLTWYTEYQMYLSNATNPGGDRQYLVATTTMNASPYNLSLGSRGLMIEKTGSAFVTNDIGWFQVQLSHAIQPNDLGDFFYVQDSPQNVNREEQVTTGISFNVGFQSPTDPSASFGYSSSETHTVSQWNVIDQGTNVVGTWSWQNQDPWMYRNSDWKYGYGGGLTGAAEFRKPNSLAADQLTAVTAIAYGTNGLLRSIETLSHTYTVTYLNTWSSPFKPISHQYVDVHLTDQVNIDMSAVIPVPIQSVTFSANPVNALATNQVTGTITLASAAPIDTLVYLSSDSDNATVTSVPVTVRQGQTSATFQVLVNADGLAPGQSTVATIQAFNAEAAQAQLTVRNGS